ncbi:MAG: plastocyanin/azurin family copper-binding protein [Actinomycetota bacterium]
MQMKLKLIALVSLLVIAAAACGKSTPTGNGTTTPTAMTTSSQATSTSTTAPSSGTTVAATDSLIFAPAVIRVKVGAKVTWVDAGSAPHTVTFKTLRFDKAIDQGQSVSFVFKSKGTFEYYCKIHVTNHMHGTVIVS